MDNTQREKIIRVMDLATQLNNTCTKRECTHDKPTVFVSFSGHTCALEVQIHSEGWDNKRPYISSDREWRLYFDNPYAIEKATNDQLNGLIDYLTELLERWGN